MMTLHRPALAVPAGSPWELSAAMIAIKMRWFGLVVGYSLANWPDRGAASPGWLNALLTLGLLFALLDTVFTMKGRLFLLSRYPLVVSALEAIFIGLLCRFDTGLDSPFRYYYFLSIVTCAVRYPLPVPLFTCILHSISLALLEALLPVSQQPGHSVVLMIIIMFWVAWATASLALLLRMASAELARVNHALRQSQEELEEKIALRTRELAEVQAQVVHQEKQATFGLLAAGIAHEVGNPLAAISGLVQMLRRRSTDATLEEKLAQVSGQLDRISATLRDLINFSRPPGTARSIVALNDTVKSTLSLAKYYKRLGARTLRTELPERSPVVRAAADQLTQALLNLLLNAIDATPNGEPVTVAAYETETEAIIEVRDEGAPVAAEDRGRLFQPYFTTKPHGTGLGLFMTRKLLEEHGGRVSYHPLVPGPGKVFRLHLPVEPDLTVAPKAPEHGPAALAAP